MPPSLRTGDRPLIRIVDDDPDFSEGLAFLLESKGWRVASFSNAANFLKSDAPSEPGCLILDIRMPNMSGIELQAEMRRRGIDLPIIILTGHADVESAVKTLKMGAVDFLQKPVDSEALFESIEEAVRLSVMRRLGGLGADAVRATLRNFSERERQITRFLMQGLTGGAVAERLGLTLKTVQNYRYAIYGKLRVHSAEELVELLGQLDRDEVHRFLEP